MQIYLAQNDVQLRESLVEACQNNGLSVQVFPDEKGLCAGCPQQKPDLIVLDENCSDLDQDGAFLRLKLSCQGCHVFYISSRNDRESILRAYRSGVDDYFVKPLDVDLFIEKMKVAIRRRLTVLEAARSITIGSDSYDEMTKYEHGLEVNRALYRVYLDGRDCGLTQTEYKILLALLDANGGIVARVDLAEKILGTQNVTIRVIDVHVCTLRKKIGQTGHLIETVRNRGYRFRMNSRGRG